MDREEQIKEDWAVVLSTPEGLRVIGQLLAGTQPMASIYSPDPRADAYAQGKRDLGIAILKHVQDARPEAAAKYIQMMFTEPKKEDKEYE